MDFSVLGPLQVRVGKEAVAVRRGHPRVLLTYLLLHPGEPVPGSLLADRTWNGRPPADAANAVHRMASYLRRTIAALEELPLRTTSGGYVLDVPASAVDSVRFSRLVRGAGDDPGRALASLDEALGLWRGDPLADAAELPWAVPYVAELEELHLQAHEMRLTCLLDLGRHQEAVPPAQALAATHPLREHLTRSLMLALYRSGRQSAWETDRGRVVLRYGLPSQVTPNTFEQELVPHEIWEYDNIPGQGRATFVFADREGLGYDLLHSTVPGEPSVPNWEQLLRR